MISGFDLVSTDFSSILAGIQLAVDAILFILILFLYRKIGAFDQTKLANTLKALEKGQKLCRDLEKNIEEKARLVKEISGLIETPATNPVDAPPHDPGSHGNRAKELAVRLWKEGMSIERISRETGLQPGEIELLTGLSKCSHEDPAH